MNALIPRSQQHSNNFQLKESLMTEVGMFNPMFSRMYSNDIQDYGVVDEFITTTEGGRDLDSTRLAGVAGKAIRPQAVPQSQIIIPNTFNERRCIFMFAVETITSATGHPKITIMSGYTDRIDVTLHGSVAPDLRMYINSVMQVNSMGVPRAVDISQIINGSAFDAFG